MILTNHLYDRKEVLMTLMASLLNRDKYRTMFWAFELYYSGFQKLVFEHLLRIYTKFYEKNHPTFRKFFMKKYRQWNCFRQHMTIIEKERIVSIILLNLLYRNYEKKSEKEVYVFVHIRAHYHYYPFHNNTIKPYNVLKIGCRYGINDNDWFSRLGERKKEIYYRDKYELFHHWEYYAYRSPIWKERIERYKGYPDHKKKMILFLNDMYKREFYDKYGYEPDEQPLEVQKKIILS